MISATLAVEHGHCAACGEQRELFILNLRPGHASTLTPKPENTHAGVCRECWHEIGTLLVARAEGINA